MKTFISFEQHNLWLQSLDCQMVGPHSILKRVGPVDVIRYTMHYEQKHGYWLHVFQSFHYEG